MIVCHCKAVSDRAIRAAIRSGASSCQQVGRACEAGRCCGGCQPVIRELIASESQAHRTSGLLSTLLVLLGFPAAG